MATASQIRSQIESLLANRIPRALTPKAADNQESILSGLRDIDNLQAFPRGGHIELYGPASSGRTSLLQGLLANVTSAGEAAVILDASDSFDPVTARQNGVLLQNLLWIRPGAAKTQKHAQPGALDQLLKAADIILQSGGFGLVILDCANIPAREAIQIPLTSWFKMLRSVENTRTAFVSTAELPLAGSSASVTVLLEQTGVKLSRTNEGYSSGSYVENACLIDSIGTRAEVTRARQRKPPQSASRVASFTTTVQEYR